MKIRLNNSNKSEVINSIKVRVNNKKGKYLIDLYPSRSKSTLNSSLNISTLLLNEFNKFSIKVDQIIPSIGNPMHIKKGDVISIPEFRNKVLEFKGNNPNSEMYFKEDEYYGSHAISFVCPEFNFQILFRIIGFNIGNIFNNLILK